MSEKKVCRNCKWSDENLKDRSAGARFVKENQCAACVTSMMEGTGRAGWEEEKK